MDLNVNFQTYIIENFDIRSEHLIDDYFINNRTNQNEKELRKLCLYEKALICSENEEFEKVIRHYYDLLEKDFHLESNEKKAIQLFICQNYIKLNKKEKVLPLIKDYFNDNNERSYDLDYLICYAKITEDIIIKEPYLSILYEKLFKLGYKDSFPTIYKDLIYVYDLYSKESIELGKIVILVDKEEKKKRIDKFLKHSKFDILISQLISNLK